MSEKEALIGIYVGFIFSLAEIVKVNSSGKSPQEIADLLEGSLQAQEKNLVSQGFQESSLEVLRQVISLLRCGGDFGSVFSEGISKLLH